MRCAPWSSSRPPRRADAAPAPVTAERLATAQEIPPKFLESILLQLRRGGHRARPARPGGRLLAGPAGREITLADVIRVDRRAAGQRARAAPGGRSATRAPRPALQEVWIALRASEREILELVTIADVATGKLPDRVRDLAADPSAWA